MHFIAVALSLIAISNVGATDLSFPKPKAIWMLDYSQYDKDVSGNDNDLTLHSTEQSTDSPFQYPGSGMYGNTSLVL